MRRPNYIQPNAFSLVELIIVVAMIGVLMSLLLPAVQAAREAGRRSACQNNLRQIGIALHGHEDAHQMLPIGAQHAETFGVSWWVEIAPYLDETAVFGGLERRGAHSGTVLLHGANGRLVDRLQIATMSCPSSAFPLLKSVGTFQVMMPSYVGIAGATSHDNFPETRVATCCAPENGGEISGGGVLIPNVAITMQQVFDGLSKTLVVGETSDISLGADGREYRIDGGNPNGWIAGTTAIGTPPNYHRGFSPPSWNITTVRYGLNTQEYDLPGIDDNRGANNPLISTHPHGVLGLMLDGSVDFLSDEMEVLDLKRMVTRDDGQISQGGNS